MGLIRRRLHPSDPRPLPEEEARRYDHTGDEDVDYSDIPDLSEVDWPEVDIDRHGRIVAVRVPVEESVLAWYRDRDPAGFAREMSVVLARHAREVKTEER